MRQTVDEKLQGTLEKRLGESFTLVTQQLKQVHEGLGDMQKLATGVGDLKRVLTNVKSRGTWGETQLAAILEDMLAPDQYIRNVRIKNGSSGLSSSASRFRCLMSTENMYCYLSMLSFLLRIMSV
jgi:DNA recombination protein RmuC